MNYVNRTPSSAELDEEYQDNSDVVIQNQADQSDKKSESYEEPDFNKEMRDYIRKAIEERLEQGDLRHDLENLVEEKLNAQMSANPSRMSATKASHRK
jgi:hypothetical protein